MEALDRERFWDVTSEAARMIATELPDFEEALVASMLVMAAIYEASLVMSGSDEDEAHRLAKELARDVARRMRQAILQSARTGFTMLGWVALLEGDGEA